MRSVVTSTSQPLAVIAYMDAPFVQTIISVMQKSERLQPYIRTLREFSLPLVPDGMCGLAPLANARTRGASQ